MDNDLPVISQEGAIPDATNFVWVQWGQDLATKIPSFPTTDRRSWDLIQQLVEVMGWEVGFGPSMSKVDALQAADASISDWSANASFFFRPRTILPAKLRTAISASGSPTTIELNDSGLPAEVSEFPVPPAGEQYPVIIDREMFSYTGVTPDARDARLPVSSVHSTAPPRRRIPLMRVCTSWIISQAVNGARLWSLSRAVRPIS